MRIVASKKGIVASKKKKWNVAYQKSIGAYIEGRHKSINTPQKRYF